jgi:hypothetical protein
VLLVLLRQEAQEAQEELGWRQRPELEEGLAFLVAFEYELLVFNKSETDIKRLLSNLRP